MAVKRVDAILAPDWLYSKFEKTPEGFLKGRAVIATTGVYDYLDMAGNVIKELRLPDEVFAPAFLDSLKLKPITLLHPDKLITADNVKDYQIGTIGNVLDSDGYHLSVDMIIHDAEAIKAIESGTQQLSVGYECTLEAAQPGDRWCGQMYDYIQRDLKANHLSVVPAARAGDAARIKLDSADAVLLHSGSTIETTMSIGGIMPELKSIKLDGVEYSAEGKVIESLHLSQTKVDELSVQVKDMATKVDAMTTEKDKLEAERDTLKNRLDEAEAKIVELEKSKMDEAAIAVAVARRVRVMDAAKLAEVEVADGMTELDIQKAVITKVFPKANLDGKSDEYIDARFDGAVEVLAIQKEQNADAQVRVVGNADAAPAVNTDGADGLVDSRKAREKMIENLRNGYRGEKK